MFSKYNFMITSNLMLTWHGAVEQLKASELMLNLNFSMSLTDGRVRGPQK